MGRALGYSDRSAGCRSVGVLAIGPLVYCVSNEEVTTSMLSEVDENRIIIGRTPCRVPADLFKSDIFHRVLKRFVARLIRHDSPHLGAIKHFRRDEQEGADGFPYDIELLTKFFMFLSMQSLDEVIEALP